MDINNGVYYNYQQHLPSCFEWAANPVGVFFWKLELYKLLFSVWDIELPENWDLTPFRYFLFGYGSLGVVYTDQLGWIYGGYGVEKVGWQYDPIRFNVTNVLLPSPAIGIKGLNGAVLHVSDSWVGFDPLITHYAEMLDRCDSGVTVNLKQIQHGKVFGVENEKDATSIKTAYKKSADGDPIVIVNKRLLSTDGDFKVSSLMGDLKQTYMADDVMTTRMMILKDFLTRIGVRTVGMEKREHLLNQEIDENNDETGATPYTVMTSLEKDLKLLNSMGCRISIKPRYTYEGAGVSETGGETNVLL